MSSESFFSNWKFLSKMGLPQSEVLADLRNGHVGGSDARLGLGAPALGLDEPGDPLSLGRPSIGQIVCRR